MRRKDREISDINLIKNFIAEEKLLRVAFYDEGDIYIVPINYGFVYENGNFSFYAHGAKAGKKYNLALNNPVVGFEIDGKYKLIEGERACDYSAAYQSVIGTGKISVVEDRAEKIKGLTALMKQSTSRDITDFSEKMLDAVAVFRIDAEKLSCKAHI